MAGNTAPRPPLLPAGLSAFEGSEASLRIYQAAAREEPLEGLLLKNADLSGEELEHLSIRGCVLEHCRFTGADLSKAAFTDCTLKNCDFSGAKLSESYFGRCVLSGCKAVGANFAESRLFDTLLQNGQLRYACFDQTKWDRAALRHTCLAEAMLNHAKLLHWTVQDCDLSGCGFAGTPLNGTDLRGCRLDGAFFGEDHRALRGAVVDWAQAAELARLLGVVIKD